jgi:hypothetical protein
MRFSWVFIVAAVAVTGCQTFPPGAERGPHGTMAYQVPIGASDAGVKIYTNGQYAGEAPLTLKIFGDTDGTFHNFGADLYVLQAAPAQTNQYAQTRVFHTGGWFMPEDKIPASIHFDVNKPAPTYVPVPVPYYYPTPAPYYYGPRWYYGSHWYYHGQGYYHQHGGLRVR